MSNKNKKRGFFNQVVEEPEEEKNEVIESTPMVIDPEVFETKLFVEEEPEITPEDLVAQEEFINEAPAEPCKCDENCVCTEPCACVEEKLVEEPKPQRTIESLSRAELRMYRTSGQMPK
jgi:hypothetical protein